MTKNAPNKRFSPINTDLGHYRTREATGLAQSG